MDNISALVNKASSFLKKDQIIHGEDTKVKEFTIEKRGNFYSECSLVLLPNNVQEVSMIVKLCNEYLVKIVPQSGNSGLVGGAVAQKGQVILSSKNLNKIIEVNKANYSMKIEAGVVLKDAKNAANIENLMLPITLPSENQCTVGGNLATNAGGFAALKYGTTKDITLGLQVVLPTGEIYDDLNLLRKRNIGSDLKHLFIGSEGTLGFITAGTFKVVPKPKYKVNLLVGVNTTKALEELFHIFYNKFFGIMGAFEVFSLSALNLVMKYYKETYFPINNSYKWYGLIALEFFDDSEEFTSYMHNMLAKELNNLNIEHFISNEEEIWQVRWHIPAAQKLYGESLKHDIALPLGSLSTFMDEMLFELDKTYNHMLYPVIFGHMGDGNLHFNISKRDNSNGTLKDYAKDIKNSIINKVMSLKGTFSAEHGVGLLHKKEMEKFYFYNQLINLKAIKKSLDPNNIFNSDKIF